MSRTGFTRLSATALVLLSMIPTGSSAGTQQAQSAPEPAPRSSVSPAATGRVIGVAWKSDNTRYPSARIRLRFVTTGRAVDRTATNAEGEFHFERVEPGPYVVELVSENERVLALGDLFGVAPGSVVTTAVRLSSRAPWFAGFFTNAAAAAISAASSIGITALGSNGRPVSPQ
jgi:hypothetical protein